MSESSYDYYTDDGSTSNTGYTGTTRVTSSPVYTTTAGTTRTSDYSRTTGATSSSGYTGTTGATSTPVYTTTAGTTRTSDYSGTTSATSALSYTGTTGVTSTPVYTTTAGTTKTSDYSGTTGATSSSGYTGTTGATSTPFYTTTAGTTRTSDYSGTTGATSASGYTGTTGATSTPVYTTTAGTTRTSDYSRTTGATSSSGYTGTTGVTSTPVYTTTAGTTKTSDYSGTTSATSTPVYTTTAGTTRTADYSGTTSATSTPVYTTTAGTTRTSDYSGTTGYSGNITTRATRPSDYSQTAGATSRRSYGKTSGAKGTTDYTKTSGKTGYARTSDATSTSGYTGTTGYGGKPSNITTNRATRSSGSLSEKVSSAFETTEDTGTTGLTTTRRRRHPGTGSTRASSTARETTVTFSPPTTMFYSASSASATQPSSRSEEPSYTYSSSRASSRKSMIRSEGEHAKATPEVLHVPPIERDSVWSFDEERMPNLAQSGAWGRQREGLSSWSDVLPNYHARRPKEETKKEFEDNRVARYVPDKHRNWRRFSTMSVDSHAHDLQMANEGRAVPSIRGKQDVFDYALSDLSDDGAGALNEEDVLQRMQIYPLRRTRRLKRSEHDYGVADAIAQLNSPREEWQRGHFFKNMEPAWDSEGHIGANPKQQTETPNVTTRSGPPSSRRLIQYEPPENPEEAEHDEWARPDAWEWKGKAEPSQQAHAGRARGPTQYMCGSEGAAPQPLLEEKSMLALPPAPTISKGHVVGVQAAPYLQAQPLAEFASTPQSSRYPQNSVGPPLIPHTSAGYVAEAQTAPYLQAQPASELALTAQFPISYPQSSMGPLHTPRTSAGYASGTRTAPYLQAQPASDYMPNTHPPTTYPPSRSTGPSSAQYPSAPDPSGVQPEPHPAAQQYTPRYAPPAKECHPVAQRHPRSPSTQRHPDAKYSVSPPAPRLPCTNLPPPDSSKYVGNMVDWGGPRRSRALHSRLRALPQSISQRLLCSAIVNPIHGSAYSPRNLMQQLPSAMMDEINRQSPGDATHYVAPCLEASWPHPRSRSPHTTPLPCAALCEPPECAKRCASPIVHAPCLPVVCDPLCPVPVYTSSCTPRVRLRQKPMRQYAPRRADTRSPKPCRRVRKDRAPQMHGERTSPPSWPPAPRRKGLQPKSQLAFRERTANPPRTSHLQAEFDDSDEEPIPEYPLRTPDTRASSERRDPTRESILRTSVPLPAEEPYQEKRWPTPEWARDPETILSRRRTATTAPFDVDTIFSDQASPTTTLFDSLPSSHWPTEGTLQAGTQPWPTNRESHTRAPVSILRNTKFGASDAPVTEWHPSTVPLNGLPEQPSFNPFVTTMPDGTQVPPSHFPFEPTLTAGPSSAPQSILRQEPTMMSAPPYASQPTLLQEPTMTSAPPYASQQSLPGGQTMTSAPPYVSQQSLPGGQTMASAPPYVSQQSLPGGQTMTSVPPYFSQPPPTDQPTLATEARYSTQPSLTTQPPLVTAPPYAPQTPGTQQPTQSAPTMAPFCPSQKPADQQPPRCSIIRTTPTPAQQPPPIIAFEDPTPPPRARVIECNASTSAECMHPPLPNSFICTNSFSNVREQCCPAFSCSLQQTPCRTNACLETFTAEELALQQSLSNPCVQWDEIFGYHDAKCVLRDRFVVKRGTTYARQPARGGVLLYGPPGVGKTLLAQALGSEVGQHFFAISAAKFSSVDDAVRILQTLFSMSKKMDSSVIFIDDVDCLFGARSMWAMGGSDRIMQAFVDGMESAKGPQVLCATKCPFQLASSFLRHMSTRVFIDMPPSEVRCEVIQFYCKKWQCVVEADVVKLVTELTEGYSPRDLIALVASAMVFAKNSAAGGNTHRLEMPHFSEAMRCRPVSITPFMLGKFEEWTRGHEARSSHLQK